MNYLAALILIGIGMNEENYFEEYAFFIMARLLQDPEKNNQNYRLESLYD